MSESHSTPSGKPEKPYPDFPLFAHATKRWAKKIRGQLHYFGKWEDGWQAALDSYLQQKDDLHAGRKPRPDTRAAGVTVKDAVNAYLNHKDDRVESGELSPQTRTKYQTATDLVVATFGKSRLVADLDEQDFATLRKRMAQRWGVYRLADMIQHTRSIFKHAYEVGLLERPLRFGPCFKRPTEKSRRLHKAEQGEKLFPAGEIRSMIDAAGPALKAMLLLGINSGMGNSDVGHLPFTALDLDAGWIDFPRPKTGIPRRCPLWPETVAAIRDALAKRPKPRTLEDARLVFLTRHGAGWFRDAYAGPLVVEMKTLMRRLGINGRKGFGFYTLRHVFRTIADESKDQPAVDFIMGHSDPTMAGHYRERIDDSRLRAVAAHVRQWLFPSLRFLTVAG